MKGRSAFYKILIIWAIVFLMLASLPVTLGRTDEQEKEPLETKTFTNCVIWVFGKCNTVTGPLLWKLGLYCPLLDKNFGIEANGEEGEKLNVIIRGEEFGVYYGYENMDIDIARARGILFWGGQSLLIDEPIIFLRCRADIVYLNY